MVLRGHFIRREISDIEDKKRDCDTKIDQLARKERNLEGELRIYTEKYGIEKFAGTGE